jgi:hypothetical protein
MKRRLTPESRALFEAGRAGLAPTDEDRLRVAKALGLNFGVGAGIASATAKTVAGSTAKTVAGLTVASPVGAGVASGVIAAKWVAIVAVALGVGSGGLALYRAEVARVPSGPVATGAVVESVRAPSSSSLPGNPNEYA